MSRRGRAFLGVAVVILFGWGLAAAAAEAGAAKPMTVQEVIELKRLGFSDAEVMAEVQKSGTRLEVKEADAEALKAAGAGEDLIEALRTPAGKFTAEDAARMAKEGKTAQEILDALVATRARPKLTVAEARELREKQVPAAVIAVLRGQPLGAVELTLLGEAKVSPATMAKLTKLLGLAKAPPVTVADVLAMRRAGVPAEVVEALRKAAEAEEKPAVTEKPDKPDKPKKPGDGEDEDGEIIVENRWPPEFLGTWQGVGRGMGGDMDIVLVLRDKGRYTFRFGAAGIQEGTWHVIGKSFTMTPEEGWAEKHPWTMNEAKDRLTIKGATGTMYLSKVAQRN